MVDPVTSAAAPRCAPKVVTTRSRAKQGARNPFAAGWHLLRALSDHLILGRGEAATTICLQQAMRRKGKVHDGFDDREVMEVNHVAASRSTLQCRSATSASSVLGTSISTGVGAKRIPGGWGISEP